MVTFLMWSFLDSKISFEMRLIVVEAILCGRCASFTVLTGTVSGIFGGQTNSSILVSLVYIACSKQTLCVNNFYVKVFCRVTACFTLV